MNKRHEGTRIAPKPSVDISSKEPPTISSKEPPTGRNNNNTRVRQ